MSQNVRRIRRIRQEHEPAIFEEIVNYDLSEWSTDNEDEAGDDVEWKPRSSAKNPKIPHAKPCEKKKTKDEDRACVVCEYRAATVVCLPCGHAQVCLMCLRRYRKQSAELKMPCPLCRRIVKSVHRIYLRN